MDLIGTGLSFNWEGWRELVSKLEEWGVDTSEFCFHNSGKLISEETCKSVAAVIEQHRDEYIQIKHERIESIRLCIEPLLPKDGTVNLDEAIRLAANLHPEGVEAAVDDEIERWRNCGGCEQW